MRRGFLFCMLVAQAWVSSCASSAKKMINGERYATADIQAEATTSIIEEESQLDQNETWLSDDGLEQRGTQQGVVLVLGPGMARAFAGVGVLKSLHEARIPISGIVGVEMGAFIGGLFLNSSTINEFEWKFFKAREAAFGGDRFSIGNILSMQSRGDRLKKAMRDIFGDVEVSALSKPFWIGLKFDGDTDSSWVSSGNISEFVLGALAISGLYGPAQVHGREAVARIESDRCPVDPLPDEARGPVVVVDSLYDLLVKPESISGLVEVKNILRSAWQKCEVAMSHASLVIRPDLETVGLEDYNSGSQAIFRGKAATDAKLDELRVLTGVFDNDREEHQ